MDLSTRAQRHRASGRPGRFPQSNHTHTKRAAWPLAPEREQTPDPPQAFSGPHFAAGTLRPRPELTCHPLPSLVEREGILWSLLGTLPRAPSPAWSAGSEDLVQGRCVPQGRS
jgi:hypothetical protein